MPKFKKLKQPALELLQVSLLPTEHSALEEKHSCIIDIKNTPEFFSTIDFLRIFISFLSPMEMVDSRGISKKICVLICPLIRIILEKRISEININSQNIITKIFEVKQGDSESIRKNIVDTMKSIGNYSDTLRLAIAYQGRIPELIELCQNIKNIKDRFESHIYNLRKDWILLMLGIICVCVGTILICLSIDSVSSQAFIIALGAICIVKISPNISELCDKKVCLPSDNKSLDQLIIESSEVKQIVDNRLSTFAKDELLLFAKDIRYRVISERNNKLYEWITTTPRARL